ncbi:DUF3995 domain-containing protein [Amycolatopsis taiwanensis]|uniref:DUF3995 domain-containing protein n=1 Tax=Amycolatopsis taiwanensis TaxID=342230 RepID=A0A9W6R1Z9_9PSEU|nr:DUF3995 domain-containing protein [Amycolatopsis taiwanensis]GLY66070.1 hypothetical protein Atai01_26890 [Amycolatopsis taiwanensis]
MTTELEEARTLRRWPGLAAAGWGLAFAVPSFYWALGGLAGASSTIAPSLVELARERDPGFVAILWITGALKFFGGLLGLALVSRRPWGRGINRLLQFLAWGGAVLLTWHGGLFVVQGLLVETHLRDLDPGLRSVSRWYTYLWGPWFIAGGLAFLLAARARLLAGISPSDRRGLRGAALLGGFGALVLSVGATVAGVG